MRIGPLSVALDANLLQFYYRGVFNPIFCSKTSLDHGQYCSVTYVGHALLTLYQKKTFR